MKIEFEVDDPKYPLFAKVTLPITGGGTIVSRKQPNGSIAIVDETALDKCIVSVP